MMAVHDNADGGASAKEWWSQQRGRYNRGLATAVLIVIACSLALTFWIGSVFNGRTPAVADWFKGIAVAVVGYGLAMAAANICYSLGPLSERLLRPRNPERYRRVAFGLGFWISVLLPFSLPAFLACFGLVGVLMGQGRPVTRAELPGTYLADYGFARDSLTLDGDGRFTQEVAVRTTGKTAVSHGTWQYDAKNRDIYLYDGYMVVIDYEGKVLPGFEEPKPNSAGVLPVRHTAWAMELGGDDIPWGRTGIDIPHTKQKHKPSMP